MSRIKELSLPALELNPVAVKLDTHGVVWVHNDLVDECLDSLVKVSKQKILKLKKKFLYNILLYLVAVTTFFLISS